MDRETVFTMEATPVKFGRGAVEEAGWELARLGISRAIMVTEPGVAAQGHAERVRRSAQRAGVELVSYDRIRVEPDRESMEGAARFAGELVASGEVHGFVSVGGGSVLDTAKVMNLLASDGGELIEYVNPPIGAGRKPRAPLLAHLAIPTTAGTGSEATTVAVLDLPELKVKTGISHRYMRPAQAIVDPELTATLGPEVTAATGLDVVCHAVESYLARSYSSRPAPSEPGERPPYQGSNPVADVWSAQAIRTGGRYLRRAVADPQDLEARGAMMLAATMAGVGFGSAGVHIPHACAYPIAGLRHDFHAPGYPTGHGFVPHGISVIVTAPAAFRFTYEADPDRHLEVAAMLSGEPAVEPGPEALPRLLEQLVADLGVPARLSQLGYSEADLPELVAGARQQQRLLSVAPREPGDADLERIFRESL